MKTLSIHRAAECTCTEREFGRCSRPTVRPGRNVNDERDHALHAQHVKPTNDHSDDAAKLFARTPASEQLQAFATAKRLFTATTKTAPPRKSTRFAMIRVATSPM